MGVNLGGGEVYMTQGFLHGDDVFSFGVKDGGEGMAERMWGDGFINLRFFRPFSESEGELSVIKSFPPLADEEGVGVGFDS